MKKNILMIIALILIDQIIKMIIFNTIGTSGETITIIPKLLSLTYVENIGAAFGIFGERLILIGVNIVIIFVIIKLLASKKNQLVKSAKIGMSLVLAGGIGNLIDRIFRGYVLEWIKFLNWLPRLNIADIFVLIGWILVVGNFAYFTAEEWKARKRNKVELEEKNKKEG